MNFYSPSPPSCGNNRSGYSGRANANPSMSCTGVYPGGTQGGYDTYGSLSNMMSIGGQGQQQRTYGGNGYNRPTINSRMRQQVGRNNCQPATRSMKFAATPSSQMQMQMARVNGSGNRPFSGPKGGAAPNMYCQSQNAGTGPAPITVNVSAAQLSSAKNIPTHGDRQECSVNENPGVKYIPLKWEDILGKTGMNGMKVSMMPSGDQGNGNRQLKVSFGGQKGTTQSGEVPLKVVSFQPASSGRVDHPSSMGTEQMQQNGMNFQMPPQPRQCSCSNCRGR